MFKYLKTYFAIICFLLVLCLFSCTNDKNINEQKNTECPIASETSAADVSTPFETATSTDATDSQNETFVASDTPNVTAKPVATATPKPTDKPSAPSDTEFNVVSKTGLIINEVVSSNGSIKKADDGNYYDIVELFNNSDKEINLSDYYFSDKGKNLLLWRLPSVKLGPGELYWFYATGETGDKSNYAPFSISSDGEKLYLSDGAGNVIDALSVPKIPRDMSFGRNGDGFVIYKSPSIGAKNEGLYYIGMAGEVTASVSAGVYSEAKSVTLSSDGVIYYTTDGTRPTVSSIKYSGEAIEVSKSMAIRAFSVRDGYCDSEVKNFSYLIKIPDFELDVVTLSVKASEFENMSAKYNERIEIEAGISYFSNGKQKFSECCAIEINGQTSQAFDKKSFKVSFKSKYGAAKLKYKLFDDSDQNEFNSFVLRSGGGAQASYCAYINDEFFTSIVNDSKNITTVYSQLYKPVNVYINGEYWGVYFIREKVNQDFIANRMGVSASSVSILVEHRYLEQGKNDQGYKELYNFICTKSLTSAENYNYVASKLDLESVADYYILESFAGNFDAGNVRVCKSSEGGKWQFIFYDLDYSFAYKKDAPKALFKTFSTDTHDGLDSANAIIYKLMQTSKFQSILFERLDILTKNELSSKNLLARWDNLINLVSHDMKYNIERWTGHDCEPGVEHTHNTFADWERVAKAARNTYLTEEYVNNFVSCFKSVGASMLAE